MAEIAGTKPPNRGLPCPPGPPGPPGLPGIVDRLIASGHENASWSLAILSALDSEQALETLLDGAASAAPVAFPQPTTAAKTPTQEPPGVYVSSVTVNGFRGIGPTATLSLKHGPGLTLVVGRNGSGLSWPSGRDSTRPL